MITANSTPAILFQGNAVAPTGYTVVKNDGTVQAGAGAISTPFANCFEIVLDATETNVPGVISIILTPGVLGLGGQYYDYVTAPPSTGSTPSVGITADPASTGYNLVKADGTTVAGGAGAVAAAGPNGCKVTLVAAETNVAGPLSVEATGGATTGVANTSLSAPIPPVVTQTITIKDDAGNLLYTGLPLSGMTQAQLRTLLTQAHDTGAINVFCQDSGLMPPPAKIARFINDQRGF